MRKKIKSIIEAKKENITTTQSRKDWGVVTGKKDYPKSTYTEIKIAMLNITILPEELAGLAKIDRVMR